MDEHNEEALDLDLINIIAQIPANTSRLTLTAQYFDSDGNPVKVASVMNASDLYEARKDFLENVEDGDDYNVRYAVTEEGLRWLEEMKQKRQNSNTGDEDFE